MTFTSIAASLYGYPDTEIYVTVERQGNEVIVSMTNRGDGISSEELPRLFDRFYRTQAARAGPVAGLGLGLYITKGLVEAHGGKIWAESVPGQTTTFRFTLPISTTAQASEAPTPAKTLPDTARRRPG